MALGEKPSRWPAALVSGELGEVRISEEVGGRTVTVNYFVLCNTGDTVQNSCQVGLAWDSNQSILASRRSGPSHFNPNRLALTTRNTQSPPTPSSPESRSRAVAVPGEEVLDVPPPSGSCQVAT